MSNQNIDRVNALAEVIRKSIQVSENNILSADTAFVDNLPKDITVAQVEAVQNYTTDFVAASGIATGAVGTTMFKENADLNKVSAVFSTPTLNTVEHVLDRTATIAGEEKANYLVSCYVMTSEGQNDVLAHAAATVAQMDSTVNLDEE